MTQAVPKSQISPKAFICHASEDKERFVTPFATSLRNKGVEVWLDKWEVLLGDQLIGKVFEEGLKEAKTVIIVLSKHSVSKPWVKEEIYASFAQKLEKGIRLIPVILDDCEVPVCLKSTRWERITDLGNYQSSLDEIVAAIFGFSDKPPLGAPPAYTQNIIHRVGDLTQADSLVLKTISEYAISYSEGIKDPLFPDRIFKTEEGYSLPLNELKESIEILEHNGLLELGRVIFGGVLGNIRSFRLTTYGFEQYADAYMAELYNQQTEKVIIALVNEGIHNGARLCDHLSVPSFLINTILVSLDERGHLKLSDNTGYPLNVNSIHPSLKRMLNHSVAPA